MKWWLNGWYCRIADRIAMCLPRRLHLRFCPYCIAADAYLKEKERDR